MCCPIMCISSSCQLSPNSLFGNYSIISWFACQWPAFLLLQKTKDLFISNIPLFINNPNLLFFYTIFLQEGAWSYKGLSVWHWAHYLAAFQIILPLSSSSPSFHLTASVCFLSTAIPRAPICPTAGKGISWCSLTSCFCLPASLSFSEGSSHQGAACKIRMFHSPADSHKHATSAQPGSMHFLLSHLLTFSLSWGAG